MIFSWVLKNKVCSHQSLVRGSLCVTSPITREVIVIHSTNHNLKHLVITKALLNITELICWQHNATFQPLQILNFQQINTILSDGLKLLRYQFRSTYCLFLVASTPLRNNECMNDSLSLHSQTHREGISVRPDAGRVHSPISHNHELCENEHCRSRNSSTERMTTFR